MISVFSCNVRFNKTATIVSDIQQDRATDPGAVLFFGLVALLTFAPLFRAGNRPLPLLIMELMALALLCWRFWSPLPASQPLSRTAWIFLVLLFLLPLAQLLSMPLDIWAGLPGRTFYADALRQAGVDGADFGWRAISLIPMATESAGLALLPPLAVFVAANHLPSQQLERLVQVFLGIATVQALLGLIQYGDGPESLFRFGNDLMGRSASGTYVSRNHLAGLLEMALPIGLALLAATVGHGRPPHDYGGRSRRHRTLRQWLARFSVARINQAVLFGAVAIAILLGLIFTRSRMGIGMAMLGILLCTLLFSHRLGGRNTYGLIGTITAVGVGLASLVGLAPIFSRFTVQDPLEDGRWKIFDVTVQAIGEFFPLGSGAGTYQAVMQRFHPEVFPGVIINHAHNDYLEWLLELGLVAVLLVAIVLLLYIRQWGRVWKRGEWAQFRFVQAGAGIALLLMLLHSLVDFNLRIPANAVFTAFLAAIFFHRPPDDERRRPARRQDATGESKPAPVYAIPPENQSNPFA